MKQYLKVFKVPFIIVGVLLLLAAIKFLASYIIAEPDTVTTRTNTQCTTEERVFDYADVLTDEQEDSLRQKIAENEEITKCDIVIVTLNESLEEYAKSYEDQIGYVEPYQYVMVYADNFYDEHMMGYNKPYGDGVLFLDNWYREADGKVYSWMCTTGKAEDKFSSEMIDSVLDSGLAFVESDPYGAYCKLVDLFTKNMQSKPMNAVTEFMTPMFIFIASLVITGIFLLVNLINKDGRDTTTELTYVVGGKPDITNQNDVFLYKNVTKRRIESSSGGGGGHHTSAGGHSHGGGGHSR